MRKFYLVWSIGTVPVVQHGTELEARREAERLSAREPSRQFYVLEARSMSKVQSVQTTVLV